MSVCLLICSKMDFHAARRMFESASAGDVLPPQTSTSSLPTVDIVSPSVARVHSLHTSNLPSESAPVLPSTLSSSSSSVLSSSSLSRMAAQRMTAQQQDISASIATLTASEGIQCRPTSSPVPMASMSSSTCAVPQSPSFHDAPGSSSVRELPKSSLNPKCEPNPPSAFTPVPDAITPPPSSNPKSQHTAENHSQQHVPTGGQLNGNDVSDYSDVGDYTADTEFYVPGVNDDAESLAPSPLIGSLSARYWTGSSTGELSSDYPRQSVRVRPPSLVATNVQHHRKVLDDRNNAVDDDVNEDVNFIMDEHALEISDFHLQRSSFATGSSHNFADHIRDKGDNDDVVELDPVEEHRAGAYDLDERIHEYDSSEGEGNDDNDSSDVDDGFIIDEQSGVDNFDEEPVGVVRQHSNFSRLSAQSWLTVDSAQDVPVGDDGAQPSIESADSTSNPVPHSSPPPGAGTTIGTGVDDTNSNTWEGDAVADVMETDNANVSSSGAIIGSLSSCDTGGLFMRRYSGVVDHDPATLFGVDSDGNAMNRVFNKSVTDMSVLECCVVLQTGVAAYKKKSFRRFGARRVWLGPQCDRLYWTSKKDGFETDQVKLQRVVKLKCTDRELSIDVTEGYRISLLFERQHAGLWVRALSCLIPLQARIRESLGVILPDKEREDYTLSDDIFDGVALRDMMAVNGHVVLCNVKGHARSLGHKLAFSKAEGSFCCLRYIPRRVSPLLLRSCEEIAVLKRLTHANVVKYHECLVDSEKGGHYVVFENLPRGAFMDGSKLEGAPHVKEETARETMKDLINGLEYLHSLRIAHGDIRPDHLLRSANGVVKINPIGCITHDFTEVTNGAALCKARLGGAPCAFLAPEQCWLHDGRPIAHRKSYAMDVWALGVVLYFMLYGRVPFGGRDDHAVQHAICTGKLRFPRVPETSKKVRSLLKGVLGEKDPKTRIALAELKTHPWFADPVSSNAIDAPLVLPATPSPRVIVTPDEVHSAVQTAKVRIGSKRSS